MGRDRARKPRKIGGMAGLLADTIVHLDELPQLERINDEPIPNLGSHLLVICLDPAVMVLRRDLEKCGREGFYQAARTKGLSTEQTRKLEGALILLDNLRYTTEANDTAPDREGEDHVREEEPA